MYYDKNFNVFPTHWIEGKSIVEINSSSMAVKRAAKESTDRALPKKKATTKRKYARKRAKRPYTHPAPVVSS